MFHHHRARYQPSILILTGVISMLSSCLPDPLEVDNVPMVKREMVVASQMLPEETLLVLLTRTFGALEIGGNNNVGEILDKIAVNDALVTIEGYGAIDTLQFLGNGFYGGVEIDFKAGEKYTLHAESEALGEVSAETTVKPHVPFKHVDAELVNNEYGDTLIQVIYTFQDPSPQNWYMMSVQKIEAERFIEDAINPRTYTRLLDDVKFNGELYTERVSVVARHYAIGDTIAIMLSNIHEDYYEFINLRMDNRASFLEFLGEPVNYPSNVRNGKGFFNLYLPDIRTFVLGQEGKITPNF